MRAGHEKMQGFHDKFVNRHGPQSDDDDYSTPHHKKILSAIRAKAGVDCAGLGSLGARGSGLKKKKGAGVKVGAGLYEDKTKAIMKAKYGDKKYSKKYAAGKKYAAKKYAKKGAGLAMRRNRRGKGRKKGGKKGGMVVCAFKDGQKYCRQSKKLSTR